MNIVITLLLFVLGSAMGSFAGASVWRLRAHQLRYDKKHNEEYDKSEYSRLKKVIVRSVAKDRSRCLSCGHELSARDLIPVFSWVAQKGKCRYCKSRIGYFELIIEVSLGLLFAVSYFFWPFGLNSSVDVAFFVLWLITCVLLAVMFAYDAKWFLLPDALMNILIIIGLIWSLYVFSSGGYSLDTIYSIAGSVAILSGLYLFIYLISRGKWIGFGDVKLGLGLALILADWRLGFMALFLANLIGTIIVMPGLISGKLSRMQHIPFGPLMIAGFIIAFLFGYQILGMLPFVI